ncbi:hypothetical protein [Nostoc sp.]|uniref:hypothetical protein n=1 Tax=Nostoc sp. TaxID=1180 RepID=UPI002FF4D0C7
MHPKWIVWRRLQPKFHAFERGLLQQELPSETKFSSDIIYLLRNAILLRSRCTNASDESFVGQ